MLCDLRSASSPLCAGFTRIQGRQASPGPVYVRHTGQPLQSTQAVFSLSSCLYLSLPAASPRASCGPGKRLGRALWGPLLQGPGRQTSEQPLAVWGMSMRGD